MNKMEVSETKRNNTYEFIKKFSTEELTNIEKEIKYTKLERCLKNKLNEYANKIYMINSTIKRLSNELYISEIIDKDLSDEYYIDTEYYINFKNFCLYINKRNCYKGYGYNRIEIKNIIDEWSGSLDEYCEKYGCYPYNLSKEYFDEFVNVIMKELDM